MTPFQAVFYNYLSALTNYLGCAVGILISRNIESSRWIFAISGAATMYSSLAVLVSS